MRILTAVVFLLISISANAGSVTINWIFDNSATATCFDGSPAAANCPLTGFEVQEQINGIWTVKNGVAATLRTTSYTNVSPGRRCYRLRANSNGTFSLPSTEACIDVPVSAPKAPTITVTVTIAANPE
jgi:hypothetical protein